MTEALHSPEAQEVDIDEIPGLREGDHLFLVKINSRTGEEGERREIILTGSFDRQTLREFPAGVRREQRVCWRNLELEAQYSPAEIEPGHTSIVQWIRARPDGKHRFRTRNGSIYLCWRVHEDGGAQRTQEIASRETEEMRLTEVEGHMEDFHKRTKILADLAQADDA